MPFGKLLPREEQYFTLFAQMTSTSTTPRARWWNAGAP
jgi:hypothetical protein